MANDRTISKSRIKKVGKILRSRPVQLDEIEEFVDALRDLEIYRASFQSPLVRVNNGIRHYARQAQVDAKVTQRLKRIPTIVDKVHRVRGLDLSRMQDIGGCRAVTETLTDMHKLRTAIERSWSGDITRVSDYVDAPRDSGYRAVHLVVSRDDRLIEIQLRSAKMHSWAQFIEGLSGALGENYKQDGVSVVQDLGRSLSIQYRCQEEGLTAPRGLDDRISKQLLSVNAALQSYRARKEP